MKVYTRDDEIADDVMELIEWLSAPWGRLTHGTREANILDHVTQMHALRDREIYEYIWAKYWLVDTGWDENWLSALMEMHA